MKLLITGGAGFIGTNIALEARRQKYKVIVFDSMIRRGVEENIPVLTKAGCEIIRGDIRRPDDFMRIEDRVDAIIHLAANPGIPWSIAWPTFDFETNAFGALNILEYSRLHGKVPVIFASTNKIYSEEINEVPLIEKGSRYEWDMKKFEKTKVRESVRQGFSIYGINENFPMDSGGKYPHSPYGVSKCTGDLYCQEYYHVYGVPTVINRMSCIYGMYQKGVEDQGWLDWFIRAKQQNLPINIYGDGKQVRDALFGTDLAKLYLLELEKINASKGQVFNVGGSMAHTTSLLEVIEFLNNKPGKSLKLTFKKWRPADQKIYISDISKVTKTLGWKPSTSIHNGINQMWKMIE